MNERVARAGEQIRAAFTRVLDAWKAQEQKRKRLIIWIGIGLIALALGFVVFLNASAGTYMDLYPGMPQDEVTRALGVLQTANIPARVENGNLRVPRRSETQAMGQLALQGIPANTPDYSILQQASGITATETQQREAQKNQWQNRLQDTIRSFTGVSNAIVSLNIAPDNNRVWDREREKPSGSAAVTMLPGYVLQQDQVNGIRHLIGSSVGIDPIDVTVIDENGVALAAGGEEYDFANTAANTFLDRMELSRAVEEDLEEKARDTISLQYPDTLSQSRINATVTLDFDAVVREVKHYFPSAGLPGGLLDEEEMDAIMNPEDYALGVVGETDNTDVPQYVDLNGDDVPEIVDVHYFRDWALDYTLEQITKDGPTVGRATIAVMVAGALENNTLQAMRQAVAMATGLDVENVNVTGVNIPAEPGPDVPPPVDGLFGIPWLYIYIAAAVLVALLLVLILLLILRGRSKKKKLALAAAEAEAEMAEAERIQQEIEERKKQLKNAAMEGESANAITNEVRDFARDNPEITANLLRNWLKDEGG